MTLTYWQQQSAQHGHCRYILWHVDGHGPVSWHRTAQHAESALRREKARFARSVYASGGAYINRSIRYVDDQGDLRDA